MNIHAHHILLISFLLNKQRKLLYKLQLSSVCIFAELIHHTECTKRLYWTGCLEQTGLINYILID